MDKPQTTTCSLENLAPGEVAEIPLPVLTMGRRAAYQRIQRDAYAMFGAGGYKMRAAGCMVRVLCLSRKPKEAV